MSTRMMSRARSSPDAAVEPAPTIASPPIVRHVRRGNTRAAVGALLVVGAIAATFMAWRSEQSEVATSYVVAARDLVPGQVISADDVATTAVALTPALASAAYTRADAVIGRALVSPMRRGELMQRSALVRRSGSIGAADDAADDAGPLHLEELSFAIDGSNALDGRMAIGDRIDLFAVGVSNSSGSDETSARVVARDAIVLRISGGGASVARQLTLTVAVTPSVIPELLGAIRHDRIVVVRTTGLPADAFTTSETTSETTS